MVETALFLFTKPSITFTILGMSRLTARTLSREKKNQRDSTRCRRGDMCLFCFQIGAHEPDVTEDYCDGPCDECTLADCEEFDRNGPYSPKTLTSCAGTQTEPDGALEAERHEAPARLTILRTGLTAPKPTIRVRIAPSLPF